MTKTKAVKIKEMRKKDTKNFLQTIQEEGKTWESCDPPYEPFVRYCNIRKAVKEIIATSEEDINIYPELIELLDFWAPGLEIDKKKLRLDSEGKEVLVHRIDDNEVYSTHLAVHQMSEWVRVAEMLREYLMKYPDYYTLNRKVIVIDHESADPKLVLKERAKRKLLNQQKESGEESDDISVSDSPPDVEVDSKEEQLEEETIPLDETNTSDSINTQSNNSNTSSEPINTTLKTLIPMNDMGKSLTKFSSSSETSIQKFNTPIHQIKQLEPLRELTH